LYWEYQLPNDTDFLSSSVQLVNEPQTFDTALQVISGAKGTIDFCIDSKGLSFLMQNERLWDALTVLRNRGVNLRFVTEITQENIYYCNLLLKLGEVFHNDRLIGNFMIVDGKRYVYYVMNHDESHKQTPDILQSFHTQVKSFVDTQLHLFDNLCLKAIPAKEKIRQIGRGDKGDFIEIIQTPSEIQNIATELIESATYEILLLFSTTNSFYRAEYSGILNALWQASERGVTVKLLIQGADDDNRLGEILHKTVTQKNSLINVQRITRQLETKITTLVVDQAVSLAIDVNDDTKNTFGESTGIAVYSNNELKISSSLTVFETLWIQSEFDKQIKIKQAYFQMFKGFELKDELYVRRWSFEQKQQQTKKQEE
jgi:sugar-specific transcriptional regulator TrmB